jgi:hypothetical protein
VTLWWCLADRYISHTGEEHRAGELHYDRVRRVFWLGENEADDYTVVNVTELAAGNLFDHQRATTT